ncbi:hypothetical protein [Pseudomonas oryziphila]|uniref:hypothetical protein n=1 Tax=Pseudomonas oryziphila TaxID=2894079 RepID=UPI001CC217AF|nr:hypothetical protein [Pseudomonas oryziphila]
MATTPGKASPSGKGILQVAITPLAEIQAKDVGRGAAVFDAWLREVSAGHATLERLKAVAGNVPVAGNSIALIDALGAIATLARSKVPDPLDCATFALNLIALVTSPAGEAPARMSLRPMLLFVRQEGKQVLDDASVELLAGHLNADIVGSLDNFVTQAAGKLKGILAEAATLGERIILDIASGLATLAEGAGPKHARPASRHEQRAECNNPLATLDNYLAGAFSAYKHAGKGMTSANVSPTLSATAKAELLAHSAHSAHPGRLWCAA